NEAPAGETTPQPVLSEAAAPAAAAPAAAETEPADAATTAPHRVRLVWQSEMEENAFGYTVYRRETEAGDEIALNPENPLHAAGTTHIPQEYTFYDLNVQPGVTYYYRIRATDLDGSYAWPFPPAEARPKPLTPAEAAEIEANGTMYRRPLEGAELPGNK
ncbi:MAG TPA: hypothetical protein PK847_12525, partial [Candidatus Sumerlaeota bacterium]|nr:hypothetical protein [Candidatus Sumerlaeota bacterium]